MKFSRDTEGLMDRNNQIIIAAVLIIALVLALAGYFYFQVTNESDMIKSLNREIAGVSAKRNIIIEKIEEAEAARDKLSLSLENYSKRIQARESELEIVKTDKEQLLSEFRKKNSALSLLKEKLNEVQIKEASLKADLDQAKADNEDITKALEATRNEKADLEEQMAQYLESSKGVELKKIVVRMAPVSSGEIIEVNSEYNFAVADLGSEDSVRSGDLLGIYRNEQLIAKAFIENVYDDMSSIMVFDEWRDIVIRQGDTVKLIEN